MSPASEAQTRASNEAFIDAYRRRTTEVLASVDVATVSAAVDCLFEAWLGGAKVLLAGNGGSASTASHFANDLVKATRVPDRPAFSAVSMTDNQSLLTALANDDGYETVFAAQVEHLFRPGDVLIAISASGNSPNIVAAAEAVREKGGRTIALTGFDGGRLGEMADVVLHAESQKGEYGPVEDVHLVLDHMISGCLLELIQAHEGETS